MTSRHDITAMSETPERPDLLSLIREALHEAWNREADEAQAVLEAMRPYLSSAALAQMEGNDG